MATKSRESGGQDATLECPCGEVIRIKPGAVDIVCRCGRTYKLHLIGLPTGKIPIKAIIDAIVEDIPTNLMCNHCEYEMPIECVLDPDSKYDREAWIKLATRIINIVGGSQ